MQNMNHNIVIGFVVLYYAATLFLVRRVQFTSRNICLCGIVVAMTLVLESIQIPLPTGATISLCSPVPLMVLAIITDHRLSIVAGWVCGLLAMLMVPGWQLVHWGQFFVEHLICFSCLGYTAVFGTNTRRKVLLGMVLASVLKTLGHLMSGVVFFSQNAWDGWGAWGYSLMYNLSQNIPMCVLSCMIVLLLPLRTMKQVIDGRSV